MATLPGSACASARDPSDSAPWAREGPSPRAGVRTGSCMLQSTVSQSRQRVCPRAGFLGGQAWHGPRSAEPTSPGLEAVAALGLGSRRQQGCPLPPPPPPQPASPLPLAQEAELSSWERDGSIFGQNE